MEKNDALFSWFVCGRSDRGYKDGVGNPRKKSNEPKHAREGNGPQQELLCYGGGRSQRKGRGRRVSLPSNTADNARTEGESKDETGQETNPLYRSTRCNHDPPSCHACCCLLTRLNPTVDIFISQAAVGVSFLVMTALAPVLPPRATLAFVPTKPVPTTPPSATVPPFPCFVSLHWDPRRKALVFADLRRYRKGDTRRVFLVAAERPALPVATTMAGNACLIHASFVPATCRVPLL